jgi:hypothetical protein
MAASPSARLSFPGPDLPDDRFDVDLSHVLAGYGDRFFVICERFCGRQLMFENL